MIKSVRSYLKKSILSICSELKENKSAFYDGDIGETILNRTYQIELNNISNVERDSHFFDTIDASIIIFGVGRNRSDQLDNYDDLLSKALCIRDKISDLKNFNNTDYVANVTPGIITSQQLPDNDNSFRININLTLSLAYSRGE